jgi:hypothetical protein
MGVSSLPLAILKHICATLLRVVKFMETNIVRKVKSGSILDVGIMTVTHTVPTLSTKDSHYGKVHEIREGVSGDHVMDFEYLICTNHPQLGESVEYRIMCLIKYKYTNTPTTLSNGNGKSMDLCAIKNSTFSRVSKKQRVESVISKKGILFELMGSCLVIYTYNLWCFMLSILLGRIPLGVFTHTACVSAKGVHYNILVGM